MDDFHFIAFNTGTCLQSLDDITFILEPLLVELFVVESSSGNECSLRVTLLKTTADNHNYSRSLCCTPALRYLNQSR